MDEAAKGDKEMKRYGNLFSQVVSFENLLLASIKALRGKRHKHTVSEFFFNMENEIINLQQELVSGNYQPLPYHEFEIRQPKVRKICASAFRDRVVHHAISNVMEPIFEARLISDSYACRTGKGSHHAIKRCQQFTKKSKYYLKCDIRKYFDSVDHAVLRKTLQKLIKDDQMMGLIDKVLKHAVPGSEDGKGLPIGNLTSQHFANFYLGLLDHYLKERLQLKGYLRYMDDFICFADSKAELHDLLAKIRAFCREELKLELKEKVVKIAPVSEGVPFLSFRIYRQLIRIQRVNLVRMRRNIKRKERDYLLGRIDQDTLVRSVNSMIAHVQHADTAAVRRDFFERSLKLA
jgi:RNA-directed DNA polymerase